MIDLSMSALCLVPPFLVLLLGILTHRVLFSLACGLISAALLATQGLPHKALSLLATRLWGTLDLPSVLDPSQLVHNDTLLIFFFLGNLGIIVTLLEHSGGAAAYAETIRARLRSRRQVERASILLSLCLFIDDYFSSLTVGTIMRPLTDHFSIPRAKLAFLVDSLAAPLAILVPVSSWVAVIVGQLQKAGVSKHVAESTTIVGDPFIAYLYTIPFIAYSFILMISAALIVQYRISFGPMRTHEHIAVNEGNMFGGKKPRLRAVELHVPTQSTPSLLDFIIPISSFLIGVFLCMIWTGGHTLFGGTNGVLAALRACNSSLALAGGSLAGLLISIGFLSMRRVITPRQLPTLMSHGVRLMTPAMIILFLSWTLGELLSSDLQTGAYLANTLVGALPSWIIPLMFFIASGATSFAMGSSWGTVAIIIPIAIPMLLTLSPAAGPVLMTQLPLLFPTIGAILSGAVLGDHISPISDTTIMTATSTGSYHIDHVYTQFIYVIPVLIGTAVAFALSGLTQGYGLALSSIISTSCGVIVSGGTLVMLNAGSPTRPAAPDKETDHGA